MADLRYAARRLARSPGFTITAATLLALGIGANAVIFGALDAILLRPLPVRQPEQLVHMVQDRPRIGRRSTLSHRYYQALKDNATTLSAVFGEEPMQVAMGIPAPAEQINVSLVTPEYFELLGVPAAIGRTLGVADNAAVSGPPPAVLSDGFWRRRFNGDEHALGRTIELHGHAFTVVGVMPRDFNGVSIDTTPDVRVSLAAYSLLSIYSPNAKLDTIWVDLAGRMKPGVTRERAQAEVLAIWRNITKGTEEQDSEPIQLDPLLHGVSILRQRFTGALRLLIASVALLQLMVCANLAGLLLARGAQRSGEVAIRLALGASRSRLMRDMFAESALVTILGGVVGVGLAYMAAPLLTRALPPVRDAGTTRLALAIDFSPNQRVLLYSLGISAVTALLFGMVPAFAAARVSLDAVLRGARSAAGWRGRQVLLVLQIALCTLLLAGAGLLVRTFRELRGMDLGFATSRVVSFTSHPSLSGYRAEQTTPLRTALTERVRQLPGVESVASAALPVMRDSGMKTTIVLPGQKSTAAEFMNTSLNQVTPEYFDTMGEHFVSGRTLEPGDRSRNPTPTVVNESFVERFFPGVDPVGREFVNGASEKMRYQVVGVVKDARYRNLREVVPPTIFQSFSNGDFILYVRTRQKPQAIIQPVRQALAALDPAMPFVEVHTLAEEVDGSAAPERLTAVLASIFGLLAAVLAAVGLYGLLAFAVSQRQREIGIRMALGALPRGVAQLIGGQALILVVAGVAIGLAAAYLTAPLAGALLYGVHPSDPMSFGAAAALVALVATGASLFPALRAARVDPASALRQ